MINSPDLANHIPAEEPPIFGVSRFARATISLMLAIMASLFQDVARKCNPVTINLRIGN
jgi:hypothetical protein